MLIGGRHAPPRRVKGLRVGIIVKGIIADVKKNSVAERSVKVYKIHHIKDIVLEDAR
jgi:trk system potassium uptake protein TrkH